MLTELAPSEEFKGVVENFARSTNPLRLAEAFATEDK